MVSGCIHTEHISEEKLFACDRAVQAGEDWLRSRSWFLSALRDPMVAQRWRKLIEREAARDENHLDVRGSD
jgi:hypothetical protein